MAPPSSLRAAGYRAISKATLQLGPAATPHLAVNVLPTLLAEARAVVAASDSSSAGPNSAAPAVAGGGSEEAVRSNRTVGGGGSGMKVEPAMSARKSSQKKQRRSREKEVGRALAAADAAAAAAAANGAGAGSSAGSGGLSGGGVGGGDRGGEGANVAPWEAACGALSCLTQVVLTCGGYLPLGSRLAVEDVLHRGLRVLARVGVSGGSGGRGDGGGGRGRVWGVAVSGCLPLENPRVVREFVTLAQACLVTPLVSYVIYTYILFFSCVFVGFFHLVASAAIVCRTE